MTIIISSLVILVTFYVMSEIIDKHFIKSLDNIASWLKMPESVAGATLLAFGTSAPEISTALFALFLAGASPALGVGTIVGSAIFQILVVIGFAAVVKTSFLNWKPVIRDSAFYALSILLLILFMADGQFTVTEATILVVGYLFYLFVLFLWTKLVVEEKNEPALPDATKKEATDSNQALSHLKKLWRTTMWPINFLFDLIPNTEKNKQWTLPVFLLSLAIIGYACYWLVLAGESLAVSLGIPTAIIALTILAGGSSIPEMISSAIVARQGRGDMAIANAVGSNIFDIQMSLGLPLLIYTATRGTLTDIGGANITSSVLLLFFTLIAVISLLASQRFKATRPFGILLIFLYLVYVIAAYAGWIDKISFTL
jgi:K+-dependent Na+/Ca+ exchanger-like protein